MPPSHVRPGTCVDPGEKNGRPARDRHRQPRPRRWCLAVRAARARPGSWCTRSLCASYSSSGGRGLRALWAASLSWVSAGKGRVHPLPRATCASRNRWSANRSNADVPSRASSRAARVLRAVPRSAPRTTSSTRMSRWWSIAFNGFPLAHKWTPRRDTPNSRPSCFQVRPEIRRSSETALRVASVPGSICVATASRSGPLAVVSDSCMYGAPHYHRQRGAVPDASASDS